MNETSSQVEQSNERCCEGAAETMRKDSQESSRKPPTQSDQSCKAERGLNCHLLVWLGRCVVHGCEEKLE